MIRHRMPTVVTVAALVLAVATGCTPREGESCDPAKGHGYFSSRTKNGKTTTVSLECKRVGVDRYEWKKAT